MTSLGDLCIAFVGGGTMAEAILRGILRQGLTTPENLTVSDPLAERRAYLACELAVQVAASNVEAVSGADVVVLAVKPQIFPKIVPELAGELAPQTLVLSIIAGTTLDTLRTLGSQTIVRIMPNTPGQIGEGISVWISTPEVTQGQRESAAAIVGALGEAVCVSDEKYLDMATALSGSGPAYVFLFMEALTDAGVQMGFARPIAEKLALQTVRGAALYAQQKGEHLAVLRSMVTSPGGTTAAALYELERGGLRTTIANAVLAAYRKAISLGASNKS